MFDRCRTWRRKLGRRADGTLPPAQWGALEDHLAQCEGCRAAAGADDALRCVLGTHTGLLSREAARRFDQAVLSALRRAPAAPSGLSHRLARPLHAARLRWNALPFLLLNQIAGGALVAVSVTALCLLPALHPGPAAPAPGFPERAPLSAAESTDPPVPLESLLQSPTPRAALLWTVPGSPRTRRPEPDRPVDKSLIPHPGAVTPGKTPLQNQRHSGRLSADLMG